MLRNLSAERVRKELLKLLEAHDPADTVAVMADAGILGHWLPEYCGTGLLHLVIDNERAVSSPDGLRRLAAIIAPGSDATAIGKRLRLSTQETLRLTVMLADEPRIDVEHGPAVVRRQIYHLGTALYIDRLMRQPAAASAAWMDAWHLAGNWPPPELPVSGRDVLKAGLPAGRRVGALVSALEHWWIEQDFAPDRAACLAELRRRIDSGECA
jgi:poly(A) polymerase